MAEVDLERQYKQEFMRRIAEARVARGLKQWQIAEALDMPQDRYKQYESRSLLPHSLIVRFCLICRIDPEWLLTGHGKRPMQALQVVGEAAAPVRKPKKTRAKRVA